MRIKRDEAKAAMKAAERRRPAAVEKDSAAYADALAKGGKDPWEKHTLKADEEIHQAKRLAAGLDMATRTAESAVMEAIKTHRADIASELQERLTSADRQWSEAVALLESAGQERGLALSALEWLARGDFDRRETKVGGWVPGLTVRRMGTDDAPAMFAAVMAALRNVTDPPDTSSAPQAVGGSMAAFLGVGAVR